MSVTPVPLVPFAPAAAAAAPAAAGESQRASVVPPQCQGEEYEDAIARERAFQAEMDKFSPEAQAAVDATFFVGAEAEYNDPDAPEQLLSQRCSRALARLFDENKAIEAELLDAKNPAHHAKIRAQLERIQFDISKLCGWAGANGLLPPEEVAAWGQNEENDAAERSKGFEAFLALLKAQIAKNGVPKDENKTRYMAGKLEQVMFHQLPRSLYKAYVEDAAKLDKWVKCNLHEFRSRYRGDRGDRAAPQPKRRKTSEGAAAGGVLAAGVLAAGASAAGATDTAAFLAHLQQCLDNTQGGFAQQLEQTVRGRIFAHTTNDPRKVARLILDQQPPATDEQLDAVTPHRNTNASVQHPHKDLCEVSLADDPVKVLALRRACRAYLKRNPKTATQFDTYGDANLTEAFLLTVLCANGDPNDYCSCMFPEQFKSHVTDKVKTLSQVQALLQAKQGQITGVYVVPRNSDERHERFRFAYEDRPASCNDPRAVAKIALDKAAAEGVALTPEQQTQVSDAVAKKFHKFAVCGPPQGVFVAATRAHLKTQVQKVLPDATDAVHETLANAFLSTHAVPCAGGFGERLAHPVSDNMSDEALAFLAKCAVAQEAPFSPNSEMSFVGALAVPSRADSTKFRITLLFVEEDIIDCVYNRNARKRLRAVDRIIAKQ